MIRQASRQKTLYIGIFLTIALLISAIGYFTYMEIKNVVIESLGESAEKVAITAASYIEADIEPYRQLIETRDYQADSYDQDYYNKMNRVLQSIQKDTGVGYIYTIKKISDSESVFILDGEDPQSEHFSPLGSLDQLAPLENEIFATGISAATGLVEWEKWGSYVTGFAPIRDPQSGAVISLVGVDFSSAAIAKLLENIQLVLVVTVFSLVVLISMIAFKLIGDKFEAENVDYLTELHSKRYHEYRLPDLISRAKNSDRRLFLMMIDIDYFKEINDEYGHDIGDKVLRHVADIIKASARKTDICSRFGGDEFVMILSDVNAEQVSGIARRIMEKLRKSPVVLEDCVLDGEKITISIGIAEWRSEMGDQHLTQYADDALYCSKQKGRNQITFYAPIKKMVRQFEN